MKKCLSYLVLFAILGTFITGLNGCFGCPGDTIKPTVVISFPANNSVVSGVVTIQVTADDNVGVVKVEFYVDGAKIGEDTSSPYECNWNTDNLQYNSQHTIQARAYDNAGNIGESSIITVTIGDPNAPEVTITNPQNGAIVLGIVNIQAQVTEKGKGSKAPSGIEKVEFYVDGTKIGEDTSSPYECDWDTNQTGNGYHTVMAKAYDIAGNNGTDSVEVYVGLGAELGVITWQEEIEELGRKLNKAISQHTKIHPKLLSAMNRISSGIKERSNVKNFKPLKTSKQLKAKNGLPPGAHIYLEVWWSEIPDATGYNVYLSDDNINYTQILSNTTDLDVWWNYADEDLGLQPGVTYYVRVAPIINGVEGTAIPGSWSVTTMGVVNLESPYHRELNVPTDPLTFSWQNASIGNPAVWDILVVNEWDWSGWYYFEEITALQKSKNTIVYNFDGTGDPLYPGAIYWWEVWNYRDYNYSNIAEDSFYFSLSLSRLYMFQTYASDWVKLYWGDTEKDIDLDVVEPDGNMYEPWDEGYDTPNGFFLGDEPWDHGFDFEQYSFKEQVDTGRQGTFYFYGYNWEDNAQSVTVSYNIGGNSNIFNVNLPSYTEFFLFSITRGKNPIIKVYKEGEIPPEIQKKLSTSKHKKVRTKR